MNESMLAPLRNLGVRVKLTLATGSVLELDGGDVISFQIGEGADSPLLPGSVLSARLNLTLANDLGQWQYGGSLRGERPLTGATAQVFLISGDEELPCGVFVIDSVSAQEHSGAVTLSGSDSIASELAFSFIDTQTYPRALGQIWGHMISQTRYGWSGVLPNGDAVIAEKPDWGEITLRRAAGWIAQAAGCFVRVNRTGALEIVPCVGQSEESLGPDAYLSLDDGFQEYGPVTAVRVENPDAAYTVGEGVTVQVKGNPLFAAADEALAEGLLGQIRGLTLARASFVWRGDPSVSVGSRIRLTDTAGGERICTVTRQTLRFLGGFSADCICGVPEDDGGVVRAITPEGGVNAGALTGTVNGGLLAAESVTAQAIAAKSITAEKIAVGAVSADHLSAGSVTADKLEAQSVSAQVAKFVAAQMGSVTADSMQTSELYASVAHLIELAAQSLSAGKLDADRLAAALADVVSLHAATGEFDFAAVQNLISAALSVERISAESVYIRNLAVTSANLLSATLDKLVIRGSDGLYYQIFVGSDGVIHAEQTEQTDLPDAETDVSALNGSSVQASSAVINEILTQALAAGRITAADALIASATIPALYTTSIQAIGDGLDLSANRSITSLVGDIEDKIGGGYSEIEQRVNAVEITLGEKVDGGELRAWLRYTDDGLSLGRTDSRYQSEVADGGFTVSQDGQPMIEARQNRLSAPVIAAKRRVELGGFTLRLGASGHLMIT
ncbi:MAG: hypothetical protein IJO98_02145 [Clostridia bacterium]|nr:hypothetical protein [Clostridia bacterium]